MNTPALLKTVLFVGALGLYQAHDYYLFLLHTGPLAMSSEMQKARDFKQCMQERNPLDLSKMPDVWTQKRARDTERECRAKVYEGQSFRLDQVASHPARFKLNGRWYSEGGQAMMNSREGCLAILNDGRKFNRHGLNPEYESRQKARCDDLYTEAEDKLYPKDTPW
jgi:hypothetical protein